MAQTINIQRLWDQKYRDESVPFPIDGTPAGGGASFDPTSYGAKFDGVTNDTAAHQAAIDAASAVQGTVTMPPGISRFSNLKVTANMRFVGSGMNETILQRVPGSTGTAIREKTIGEGNPSGATGLWIKDLQINGNGTTGDGLDIGNQVPGAQLNFNAAVENIHVRDFPAGTGIRIRGNAVQCKYLWSNLNDVGIETQGGANAWYSLLAEGNTTRDVKIETSGDSYYHIQVETTPATLPIEIAGSQNSIFGIYVTIFNAATNIIQLSIGANRNSLHEIFVDDGNGAHAYTHVIYIESQSTGTGSSQFRFPAFLSTDSEPVWVYDQGTNIRMKVSGTGIDSDPPGFAKIGANGAFQTITSRQFGGAFTNLTYSPTIAVDATVGNIFAVTATNTTAFTVSKPTGGVIGQQITILVTNASGGTLGAITWGSGMFLAGAFTNPASGKSRTVSFYFDLSGNWVEYARSAADIG